MKKLFSIYSAILFLGFSLYGQELPKMKMSSSKLAIEYWKHYRDFRSKVCSSGVSAGFHERLKDYRGGGFYLPIIKGKMHADVFPDLISELEKKISWMEGVEKKLKKSKSLPDTRGLVSKLKKLSTEMLKAQEKVHRYEKFLTEEEALLHYARLKKFTKLFNELIEKSYYLRNYKFPVDHFLNRMEHDEFYAKKGLKSKIEQKKLFLKRKLVEDGAPGTSHSGSDKFFRTTLDTLTLKVKEMDDWYPEDIRYDLEYALGIMGRVSKLGSAHYLKRFAKWKETAREQLVFYKKLHKSIVTKSKGVASTIQKKQRATSRLSSYVVSKQLNTYDYWRAKPVFFQALFALETILYNEVGGVDPTGLERRDVLQVVLNRYKKAYYRRLKKNQKLYKLLAEKKVGRSEFPWLNILFNKGEFSFTYYYFKASEETFCPNMSKTAMKLKRENLNIALGVLKKPDWEFKAERYFSRASMTGRIDMSQIWSRFTPVVERPGKPMSKSESRRLTRSLKKGNYRYFYRFNIGDIGYHVVEIGGKERVFQKLDKSHRWFAYRNPHYFRYFVLDE